MTPYHGLPHPENPLMTSVKGPVDVPYAHATLSIVYYMQAGSHFDLLRRFSSLADTDMPWGVPLGY